MGLPERLFALLYLSSKRLFRSCQSLRRQVRHCRTEQVMCRYLTEGGKITKVCILSLDETVQRRGRQSPELSVRILRNEQILDLETQFQGLLLLQRIQRRIPRGRLRLCHTSDCANNPGGETLNHQTIEYRLIDPTGQRDERFDLTQRPALEIQAVRIAHNRAHAHTMRLDAKKLRLLKATGAHLRRDQRVDELLVIDPKLTLVALDVHPHREDRPVIL